MLGLDALGASPEAIAAFAKLPTRWQQNITFATWLYSDCSPEALTRYMVAAYHGPCWFWNGWNSGHESPRKVYGIVVRNGAREAVHRRVYCDTIGPIADGLVLDHYCNNRLCCNPFHTEPVTSKENTRRGDGYYFQFRGNRHTAPRLESFRFG